MPSKPLRPCKYPGCPELVTSGYCAAHDRPREVARDPERQRLYDRAWQRRRRIYLASHPWCEACLVNGVYEAATDVHHVVPHRGDREVFKSSPLMALCHACHSRITASEGRGGEKDSEWRMSSVGGHPREKISQCGESS